MKDIVLFSFVTFADKLVLTKHLAIMLKAGIPLHESLDVLANQTTNHKLKNILAAVAKDVRNGNSLQSALEKYPRQFDRFYLSLIAVGEKTGRLDENLAFLAEQMGKAHSLKKKVQSAMFYPMFVLTAAVIIGGAIAFFVLPRLVDFFEALNVELPFTTRILLSLSKFLKNFGGWVLAGLISSIVGFLLLLRVKPFLFFIHNLLMRVPIVSKLVIKGQLARYSRNLAALLKRGVTITDSLQIAAETLSNLKIKNDLLKIVPKVKHGKEISNSLESFNFNYLPPMVIKMLDVGEKTGELEEVLFYLADFYEDEIDDLAKNLTSILEPVLLLFIGLVIGFVALSIISPIYQLTSGLRQGGG